MKRVSKLLKICFLYQDQYPWDVRIEKFCNSLVSHGCKVNLVCRNRDDLDVTEHFNDSFIINRLSFFKNSFVNDLCNIPAFFSPFWLYKTYKVISEYGCNVIIVRDLPLVPSGILLGMFMKIPVVMDMAENYPAMIADTWKYGKVSKIDFLIRNPMLLRVFEKVVIQKLDGIFVVSEQSKRRLVSLGANSEKISIVGNTPIIDKNKGIDQSTFSKYRSISDMILLYVGGLEETRGLETVVKSIPELKKTYPDIVFLVVGTGSSLEYLKALSIKLQVENNVCFCGWITPQDIPTIIKASDICVIPHYVTEHTDSTIPNKIYDYMLQGKPVIATNSKSLIDIIENNNCGLIYQQANVKDFVEKVKLLSNNKSREIYGKYGYEAVIEKYNWKYDEKILFESLSIVLNRNSY